MFCLDTNVVIGIITGRRPDWSARIETEMLARTPLIISVVVLYELLYGAAKSGFGERNRARIDAFLTGPFEIVDFTPDDAAEAGDIRAYLDRRGTPIGPYDVLIAAQARRRGATVVTANGREFARVPHLIFEEWSG